jgi:hypothetical protein
VFPALPCNVVHHFLLHFTFAFSLCLPASAFIIAKTLDMAANVIVTDSVQHEFLSGSNYVLVSVKADSAVHDTFSVQAVVKGVLTVQSTSSKWLA